MRACVGSPQRDRSDGVTVMNDVSLHPTARLPLRAEMYLVAHHDVSGQPHVNRDSLALGLGGAILFELWLARHVVIGHTFDAATGAWVRRPGSITPLTDGLLGDPLLDAALILIRRTRGVHEQQSQLKTWLHEFAGTNLYQHVRTYLVAKGVLRHKTTRRLGLVKADAFLPAHEALPVRTRAHVRAVLRGGESPDSQCVCLCALIRSLELEAFLYHPSATTNQLRAQLRELVSAHDPAISEVAAAVDAGRGDLAVTAMR